MTFTPTAVGNRYGSVTLTDNASDSPQTILLSGVGLATPIVTLSANSLSFAGQSLGTTSAAQTLTLSNTGTAALTVTSIVTSGDFAQTNNCPPAMAVGVSCTINVTFTPTAAGTRSGSLTITDNAPGSPHVIGLGGNGADFALSVAPSTLAALAGDSANYVVKVTPDFGFTGKVLLTCSGLPPLSTCLLNPNPVTPDGLNPSSVAMTVTTTVRSQLPPRPGPRFSPPGPSKPLGLPWFLWLLGAVLTAGLAAWYSHLGHAPARARPRQAEAGCPWHESSRWWPALGLVMLLVLAWGACGGGGGGLGGGSDPNGTPAGNYTLTISGTSGPVTHTTTVTLAVK